MPNGIDPNSLPLVPHAPYHVGYDPQIGYVLTRPPQAPAAVGFSGGGIVHREIRRLRNELEASQGVILAQRGFFEEVTNTYIDTVLPASRALVAGDLVLLTNQEAGEDYLNGLYRAFDSGGGVMRLAPAGGIEFELTTGRLVFITEDCMFFIVESETGVNGPVITESGELHSFVVSGVAVTNIDLESETLAADVIAATGVTFGDDIVGFFLLTQQTDPIENGIYWITNIDEPTEMNKVQSLCLHIGFQVEVLPGGYQSGESFVLTVLSTTDGSNVWMRAASVDTDEAVVSALDISLAPQTVFFNWYDATTVQVSGELTRKLMIDAGILHHISVRPTGGAITLTGANAIVITRYASGSGVGVPQAIAGAALPGAGVIANNTTMTVDIIPTLLAVTPELVAGDLIEISFDIAQDAGVADVDIHFAVEIKQMSTLP